MRCAQHLRHVGTCGACYEQLRALLRLVEAQPTRPPSKTACAFCGTAYRSRTGRCTTCGQKKRRIVTSRKEG